MSVSFLSAFARNRSIQIVSGLATSLFLSALPSWAISFDFSSIGYHPQGVKLAVVKEVPIDQNVEIVLYDTTRRNPKFPVLLGATVYKISKIEEIPNPSQQGPETRTLLVDFSDFKQPGNYELRVEGTDIKSKPLQINEFLYWDNLKPIVKSFYFQRCGQDVDAKKEATYHLACHLKDALLPSDLDEDRDVVGGWHNGSDYAKYVTSTALSAARMMALFELNPKPFKYFRLEYPLFEPGLGSVDDYHHEIRAGLDWLLTMQRRDGAVYRKVAGRQWPGAVMPESDEQARYIFGVSTQDTANFAAAMAMATRNFKKADLGYSVKALLAAEKAWDFLAAHPKPISIPSSYDYTGSGEFINPVSTDDTPYRLWAAAELYITTGKEKYHQAFLDGLKTVPVEAFSWENPSLQGLMDYALYAHQPNEVVNKAIKTQVTALADTISKGMSQNSWPSGIRQYDKGSNLTIVERNILLLNAAKLTGNMNYRDLASRSVQYLYGINPMGITYITGTGEHAVSHPAHRWMEISGKALPGYLVEGPNSNPTDPKTPKGLGAMSYIDHPKATSVNESTLLNNASLIYLLGMLNDAYNTAPSVDEQSNTPSPLNYELAPERPAPKGKKKPASQKK